MDAEDLKKLRARLEARREELLAEGDLEIEPNRADGTVPDEDTQPLTEMNQVIASRRNKNRAIELERIAVALRRMANQPEDFGFCEDCEEPIPRGRLEVMPWARFCVECQSERSGGRGYRRSHAGDYLE